MMIAGFTTIEPPAAEERLNDLRGQHDILRWALPAGSEAYHHALICGGPWLGSELEIPPGSLVVIEGDLVAERWVASARPYSSQRISEVIVLGDLRARDVYLCEEFIVAGDMVVERVLVAESSGDLTLHVGGSLSARVMSAAGHHLDVAGEVSGSEAPLGALDEEQLLAGIKRGEPLLV